MVAEKDWRGGGRKQWEAERERKTRETWVDGWGVMLMAADSTSTAEVISR